MFRVLAIAFLSGWQVLNPLSSSQRPPVRQTGWQTVSRKCNVIDYALIEDARGTRVFRSQSATGLTHTYVEMNGLIFYMQGDPRFIHTVDAVPPLPPDHSVVYESEEYAEEFTWESLGVTDQTNFWIGDTLYGLFDGKFREWDAHAKAVNSAKKDNGGARGFPPVRANRNAGESR